MMFTRRILSGVTPSRAARLLTKFVVKNADGVVAGRPNVKTINWEIFKSITVAPSIKNVVIRVVLNSRIR